MSRLIDADKLKKDILGLQDCYNGFSETYDKACIIGVIDEQPTIEERKTGRWEIKAINTFELAYGSTGYEPVYECSECGGIEESYLRFDEPIMPEDASFPRFCPNCGARMEGNT